MNTTFNDLIAVSLNTSLSADADASHTMRLMRRAARIMRSQGVSVDMIHLHDHFIGIGMVQDTGSSTANAISGLASKSASSLPTSSCSAPRSGWGSSRALPRWPSSACTRTPASSTMRVSGRTRDVLYALQHIGYTIPPQADCGWIGEAGPGASYGDLPEGGGTRAGYYNDFTMRNTTFTY